MVFPYRRALRARLIPFRYTDGIYPNVFSWQRLGVERTKLGRVKPGRPGHDGCRSYSMVKRIVFWPMAMRSPSDSCFSITGSPLTSVPLVLPRSLIQNAPARTSMRPCRPEVAGSLTTTSLSGARPTVTISLGRATTRPAKGPVSKLSFAAKVVPAAMASGDMAERETVLLLSEGTSAGCQAGMIEVAGSPESVWPFSCRPALVGHRSIVALTSETLGGVVACADATGSGSGIAATGSGAGSSENGSGSGSWTSAATGSGSGSGSGAADSASTGSGSGGMTIVSGSGSGSDFRSAASTGATGSGSGKNGTKASTGKSSTATGASGSATGSATGSESKGATSATGSGSGGSSAAAGAAAGSSASGGRSASTSDGTTAVSISWVSSTAVGIDSAAGASGWRTVSRTVVGAVTPSRASAPSMSRCTGNTCVTPSAFSTDAVPRNRSY